jgi:cytochrome c2
MAVQPDKIHLVPNDENIAFLFPKENLMELGYELFKNCVTCHAINKIEETWVPN